MKLNRLIGILLTLSIMASCVCVSRISATADGETTFTVKAPDGEPTVLTVSAPTTVKVGDSFEITLKWSDYAFIKGDYPGYPSCFVADFSFDTRYVTFKTPCDTCVTLEEATIPWIDACNYGGGNDLGGVEATDKSKPNMQNVSLSLVSADEDDGVKKTYTVKIKYKAVYAGVATFQWNFAEFADLCFEHYSVFDLSDRSFDIIVEDGNGESDGLGDVNGDGYVDSLDAALVLKYDVKLVSFDESQISAGDVNGDGGANSLDAALILRYDANLINSFR